jgi:hypothetical protein
MSISTARFRTIGTMRRGRRIDPKSFDLTTRYPECSYKVPPARTHDAEQQHDAMPVVQRDVMMPTKGTHVGTTPPQ